MAVAPIDPTGVAVAPALTPVRAAGLGDEALRDSVRDGSRRATLLAVCGLGAWVAAVVDARLAPGAATTTAGVVALVLLATTTARLAGLRAIARHPDAAPRRLRVALRGVALSAAFELGLLLCAAIAWAPMAGSAAVLFSAAVLAAGVSAVLLSMDRVLRVGVPAVCLAPPFGFALATALDRHLAVVVLAVALAALLLDASRRTHDDYWQVAADVADRNTRNRELEQLSQTDALTGIANRLAFDRQLDEHWGRARRRGGFVSLLLVDLDHFKRLNDEHGHSFGDRCLVAVAAAISDEARESTDLAARYGGEEFAVLLTGTSRAAALAVAERVRRRVAEIVVAGPAERVRPTCSVGVATLAPVRVAGGADALVEAADAALYAAKRGGRDCVHQAA